MIMPPRCGSGLRQPGIRRCRCLAPPCPPPTAHRPPPNSPPNFRNCLLLPDPLHIILLKLRAILFASFWGYPLHSARSVMATGGNFRPVGRIGCGALPDVWPVMRWKSQRIGDASVLKKSGRAGQVSFFSLKRLMNREPDPHG